MAGAADSKTDPFEKIAVGELQNKMNYFVVSSDQAKLSVIEFYVKPGWDAEKSEEYGIAHLVEHILFRDGELKDNMSYLQVFEDRGGQVEASVSSKRTRYSVKIPSKHSMWTLKLLTKMLQGRKFTQSEFEKAKRSVMIEIGESLPFEKAFTSFDALSEVLDKFLFFERSDFFKNEFGVDFNKYKRPWNADRINNSHLSLEQAQSFYENFYIPKNIQVFAAGNFNQTRIIRLINKKWSHYKKGITGKRLPERDNPRLVDRPFYSIESNSYPSMRLGIKVADLNMKDFLILKSYMRFAADSIMKNVRNKKGETYTAYDGHFMYKRHGKIYVNMDSTSKAFKVNFKALKSLLFEKPKKQGVNRKEFEKAKQLFKNSFEDSYEEDADSLLDNLRLAEKYKREYGFTGSPVKLMDKVSLAEYNATLKKHIKPQRYIIQKYPRHLFFYLEGILLWIISIFLSVLFMRRMIKKPIFDLFQIRFVKNIKLLPFKMLELGIVWIPLTTVSVVYIFMEKYIFYNNRVLQSNLITGVYLPYVICAFLFVVIYIFLLSIIPKKIYLSDDSLYIKSISYRINRIPASEIQKFESIKWWKVYFSFRKLKNIGLRFYMYRITFPWTRVLLVYFKNGKIMLLDCGLTNSVFKGLNKWLFAAKNRNVQESQTNMANLNRRPPQRSVLSDSFQSARGRKSG